MRRSDGPSAGRQHSLLRRADSLLLGAVDAGLVAVIFVVPFALGGRIALGQLALVALSN